MTEEDPTFEWSLYDIFEEIDAKNASKVLEENIKFILKRELVNGEKLDVTILEDTLILRPETRLFSGLVQADFEIYGDDPNRPIAKGVAYGQIINGELIDITVEVYVETEVDVWLDANLVDVEKFIEWYNENCGLPMNGRVCQVEENYIYARVHPEAYPKLEEEWGDAIQAVSL